MFRTHQKSIIFLHINRVCIRAYDFILNTSNCNVNQTNEYTIFRIQIEILSLKISRAKRAQIFQSIDFINIIFLIWYYNFFDRKINWYQ